MLKIGLIHTINIKSNNVDVVLYNHVLHLDDMLNEIARIIKKVRI